MRGLVSLAALALVIIGSTAVLSRRDAGAQSSAPPHTLAPDHLVSRGHVDVSKLPPFDPQTAGAQAAPRRVRRALRMPPSGLAPAANAIDSAAGAAVAPAPGSQHFEGIDSVTSPIDVSPPDPQIAVGPDHVVEMVNLSGRVFDKQGGVIQTFALRDFFSVPPGYVETDPRIIYDALSGRWFATYIAFLDLPTGNDLAELEVLASETSDPTGNWAAYVKPYTNVQPDYPGLGVTSDKVTISVDVYDIDGPPGPVSPGCDDLSGFCGNETNVLQKSDLLTAANSVGLTSIGPDIDLATVRPARSMSSVSDQYLTTWALDSLDQMLVLRITGTPALDSVNQVSVTSLTTLVHDSPPPSRTAGVGNCVVATGGEVEPGGASLGPPPCIDSGDGRMLDVTWRDNHLWSSSTAACTPDGDSTERSCAHLVEVSTDGTPALLQDIMYGASGEYYSWPAITTDASANLYASITRTKGDIFAEARMAGRQPGDPANTLSSSVLLRAGEVAHDSGRWGDYLGAATDPVDTGCAWLAGEYAKDVGNAHWGTYIANASYNATCGASPPSTPTPTPTGNPPTATDTPLVDTPTDTPTTELSTPTHTPVSPTSTPAHARGDGNCDGRVNSLDALAVLQTSAGITLNPPCPDAADANRDGLVNALDAALILQFDAGLIPAFPAAGVTAGSGPTVHIGSLSQAVDQVGGVTLQSLNVASPGLGAWTVDIGYDNAIVAATSCAGLNGSVCNSSFGPTAVRVTGAVGGSGFVGDANLASISFRCVAEGESTLTLTVHVFADATTGNPQPIATTVENGTITCSAASALRGDADCNGVVNPIDSALILQLSSGLIGSVPCPQNADVNQDGHINPIDSALILQFSAGLIDHL